MSKRTVAGMLLVLGILLLAPAAVRADGNILAMIDDPLDDFNGNAASWPTDRYDNNGAKVDGIYVFGGCYPSVDAWTTYRFERVGPAEDLHCVVKLVDSSHTAG